MYLPSPSSQSLQLLAPSEVQSELRLTPHKLKFSSSLTVDVRPRPPEEFVENVSQVVQKYVEHV